MRIKRRKDQYVVTIKNGNENCIIYSGTRKECKEFCKTYGNCLYLLERM